MLGLVIRLGKVKRKKGMVGKMREGGVLRGVSEVAFRTLYLLLMLTCLS